MVTRAREMLDRSRALLERSRIAAAQFLDAPAHPSPEPIRVIEAPQARDTDEALVGICSTVALRDLNLVDSLLAQLEEMESKEHDQERLAELYRLDHLATRLRRNAENLRVLVDRDAGEAASDASSLVDVVRAAMSSIDQYSRVTIGRVVSLGVVGFVAEDLSRLLAELFDNAANQSSPSSAVSVSAHLTEQGSVLLRIEDEGIGLPPERIAELNERLGEAPDLDLDSARHMGLAVVGKLAARHGISVHLDRRVPAGTVATVLVPTGLVAELAGPAWSGAQTVVFPQANGTPDFDSVTVPPARASGRPSQPGKTSSGLPVRGGASPVATKTPSPRPRPPSSEADGITPRGLPRRVSRSIRGSTEQPPPSEPVLAGENGHDQLIADLGAFVDGEQAARDEQRRSADRETPEGNQ
jgi:two-component sensor histidine kinase